MSTSTDLIYLVDTTKTPTIYRTSNPLHLDKLAIDFYPESIPTVAGFEDLQHVKKFIVKTFGVEVWNNWFPSGIGEIEQGESSIVS